MVKNYRYDIIGADIDYGITEHPCNQMQILGFHVVKSEPVSIADCWWFRVDNEIVDIPGYLHEMKDDFRFSDEYEDSEREISMPKVPPTHKEDGTLTDYGRYVLTGEI